MLNIPYGKQFIDNDDISSVIDVLKSEFLTQGPTIDSFESAFSKYVGSKDAVAVSNGTAALHLCALALGVKEGDLVICPTITFAASANAIRYCGGEVVFCDIDPKTYLLDLNQVARIFETYQNVKGVVSVDFAGRPVDLEELSRITKSYGAWIIQDSCHSPGGWFRDGSDEIQKCGNGVFADLSIFSFHPVKHIASGEGGMVTSNNDSLLKTIRLLRTHGITKQQDNILDNSKFFKGSSIPAWYYEMQSLGFNYRLTDFQAALGLSQLKKADHGLAQRRQIAQKYNSIFQEKPFIKGHSGYVEGHAYHLYIIEVADRDNLYNFLREKGVYTQVHYFPVHLMPYYSKRQKFTLPSSERYIKGCLSLPMYPTLSSEDQNSVIELICRFYEE